MKQTSLRPGLLIVLATLLVIWWILRSAQPQQAQPPQAAYPYPQDAGASHLEALADEREFTHGIRHVYLTWRADPATTISVNYQTLGAEERGSHVYYDRVSRDGRIRDYAQHATGEAHTLAGLPTARRIHWVDLTGLTPDTTYYFVAGDPEGGVSAEQQFRTAPDDESPIRFVIGGDMSVTRESRALCHWAGEQDPLFAVVGGDIAYGNGELSAWPRWDGWLDTWALEMVTAEGRLIPMVLAIGNHEVRGGWGRPKEAAPFYFGYFAQDERSYFARQFGKNLLLLLLDSGHVTPHGGAQAEWLDGILARTADVPCRIAAYHVPLYPSYRGFTEQYSAAGREAWLPLFDKHELTTAFEHHEHTFKRTKRLRANAVDPDGTLYLGDGCFGVGARPVRASPQWDAERAESTPHFWVADINRDTATYRAIDRNGEEFDRFELPFETAREPAAAAAAAD